MKRSVRPVCEVVPLFQSDAERFLSCELVSNDERLACYNELVTQLSSLSLDPCGDVRLSFAKSDFSSYGKFTNLIVLAFPQIPYVLTCVHDIYKTFKPDTPEKKELMLTRVFAVVLPLGALIIALYIKNAYNILMFAWSFYAAAAGLPAFAALYWKKATKAGVLSGMAAGFSVTILWKLIGLPFGIGATVPGAIACLLALVLVSLATYKKNPAPFLDPYKKRAAE